jgi:putative transposase
VTPTLFGMLDDHSRVACHAQWYLAETAENFAHGVSQGLQKCELPAGLLTDNGGAETAGEIEQGFVDLGVIHETTLPHSPYQNAKQEIFWSQIEGRLLPMLENLESLTLDVLNSATLAWIHGEYNREVHSEIGVAPMRRFLDGQRVGKRCPSSDDLRRAFRLEARRTQRKSDGTVSIEGRRFEVPSRYRHMERVSVRYARWDLGHVHMIDERTKAILCPLYPLDKTRNADGLRRTHDPTPTDPAAAAAAPARSPGEIAPLLKKLMADYAATGLPPAYLPKPDDDEDGDR